VGIGTATPGVRVDIVSDSNTSMTPTLRVNSLNVAVNTSLAYDGLIASGQMTLQAGPSSIIFNTNGATERARFNSTGAFVLAGGTTTANGIGVAFPTTQSASSDANCLDDYKEGSFTATLNSGTFTSQVFKYTKIGNMVTVFFDVIVGTGGGDRITNLPYTAGGTVANGIYTNAQDYAAGTTSPVVVVGASGTVMYFRTVGDNVAFSVMTLTAAAALSGSISYFV
jgi:hypothetical protein